MAVIVSETKMTLISCGYNLRKANILTFDSRMSYLLVMSNMNVGRNINHRQFLYNRTLYSERECAERTYRRAPRARLT